MNNFHKKTKGIILYKNIHWMQLDFKTAQGNNMINYKIYYKKVFLVAGNPRYKNILPNKLGKYTVEQMTLYAILRAFHNRPNTKVVYTDCFKLPFV